MRLTPKDTGTGVHLCDEGEAFEGSLPERGEQSLTAAVRWAIAMAHSDRIPGKMTGQGKGSLAPELVLGRLSSAGGTFSPTVSPGMGKDLSVCTEVCSLAFVSCAHTHLCLCLHSLNRLWKR